MNLSEATTDLQTRSQGRQFPYTVKFQFEDGACVHIDGKQGAVAVSNEDDAADVTLKMSFENFVKVLNKDLNPQLAAMTGKIKFEGNVGVAMQLGKLLD